MDLSNFFPAAPSYLPGLLGEEQARLAQRQAQQQGLLGAALGLMQAGAPSRTPISTGQALAQGLAAGQQAYGNVLQQRVQEQMIAQQIAEQQRALREQEAARAILPSIMRQGQAQPTLYGQPTAFPLRDDEGNVMPGAGVSQGAPSLDMNAALRLLTEAPSVAAKVLPTIQQFQKFGQPERVTVKPGEQVFEVRDGRYVPVAGTERPEFVYEKLPDGTVIRLDKRGGPAEAVWSAQREAKLDDAGRIYAQVTFGKTDGLTPAQLSEAFNFQSRPSPKDYTDLILKAQAIKADTGVDLMPQISQMGQRVFGGATAAPAAEQPAVATPVPAPTAAAPAPLQPAFMQATPENPMVTNQDVPLKFRNELRASQPAVLKASIQAVREFRDLRDTAEKLLANESGLKSAVGLGGSTLAQIPGTAAADAAAILDNLKNRSFTAGIIALRQSSPNNSGVGSLTEREGARFENLQANLNQAQSFEQIRDQLRQLVRYSNESLGNLKDAYSRDFGPNKTLDEVLKQEIVQRPVNTRDKLNKIFGR
jgi:hypothetical protein